MSLEANYTNLEHSAVLSSKEILGVSENATRQDILDAFKEKMRGFAEEKNAGLKGEGNLVPENRYDELLKARDELLAKLPSGESEHKTLELHENIRTQEDMDKVWSTIEHSENKLGILAFLTTGNFLNRHIMSPKYLDKFYKMYPTEELYLENTNIDEWLDRVRLSNNIENYDYFKKAAGNFVYSMYPENG